MVLKLIYKMFLSNLSMPQGTVTVNWDRSIKPTLLIASHRFMDKEVGLLKLEFRIFIWLFTMIRTDATGDKTIEWLDTIQWIEFSIESRGALRHLKF